MYRTCSLFTKPTASVGKVLEEKEPISVPPDMTPSEHLLTFPMNVQRGDLLM